MNLFLFRYSPQVVSLNFLDKESSIVIAPESQQYKYNRMINEGLEFPRVIYVKKFNLKNIVLQVRKIISEMNINDIFTLSEKDMDWVGLLKDFFITRRSEFSVNTLFKDKYIMRCFLQGVVNQPDFELIKDKNDIRQFIDSHIGDEFIIKPRLGEGSESVLKIRRNSDLNDKCFNNKLNGTYLIEEFVNFPHMITCDGYAYDKKIVRFFLHEYEDSILGSVNKLTDNVIRTSKLYEISPKLIEISLRECKKVINEFSLDNEVTPFHFEWFYSLSQNKILFCEVGKRFGGGNIPSLIKYSYDIDILEEYWGCINTGENKLSEVMEDKIMKPKVISAIYSPYRKNGTIIDTPKKEKYNWTKNTWFFVNKGDEIQKDAESVTDIILLSEFTNKNEEELNNNLRILRDLTNLYKYE